MKESYNEGLASHIGPESCVGGRKIDGEALTGAHAGQVSSCEISSGTPTPLSEAEGNIAGGVRGKPSTGPAQSQTLSTHGNFLHGNREIPRVSADENGMADRSEKATCRPSDLHALGKSDDCVVPELSANCDDGIQSWRERRVPTGPSTNRALKRTGEDDQLRGTRTGQPRPGHRAGKQARRTGWIVCEKWHARISVQSSPPCCTTSPPTHFGKVSMPLSVGLLLAWTALRGGSTSQDSKIVWWTCIGGSTWARTGRNRQNGRIFPSLTDECDL